MPFREAFKIMLFTPNLSATCLILDTLWIDHILQSVRFFYDDSSNLETLFLFRLKSVEPVSYCEIRPKKEKDSEGDRTEVIVLDQGAKEEIYTEEHEKLLGTCNTPWTLFVDGFGKDGKRIYDQVRGQTCHQCR